MFLTFFSTIIYFINVAPSSQLQNLLIKARILMSQWVYFICIEYPSEQTFPSLGFILKENFVVYNLRKPLFKSKKVFTDGLLLQVQLKILNLESSKIVLRNCYLIQNLLGERWTDSSFKCFGKIISSQNCLADKMKSIILCSWIKDCVGSCGFWPRLQTSDQVKINLKPLRPHSIVNNN